MGGKSLAGGDAGAAWEVVMEANLTNGRKSRSIHEMTLHRNRIKNADFCNSRPETLPFLDCRALTTNSCNNALVLFKFSSISLST